MSCFIDHLLPRLVSKVWTSEGVAALTIYILPDFSSINVPDSIFKSWTVWTPRVLVEDSNYSLKGRACDTLQSYAWIVLTCATSVKEAQNQWDVQANEQVPEDEILHVPRPSRSQSDGHCNACSDEVFLVRIMSSNCEEKYREGGAQKAGNELGLWAGNIVGILMPWHYGFLVFISETIYSQDETILTHSRLFTWLWKFPGVVEAHGCAAEYCSPDSSVAATGVAQTRMNGKVSLLHFSGPCFISTRRLSRDLKLLSSPVTPIQERDDFRCCRSRDPSKYSFHDCSPKSLWYQGSSRFIFRVFRNQSIQPVFDVEDGLSSSNTELIERSSSRL